MILGPGIRNTWSADIPWVLCEGRLFGDLTPVLANHVEVTKMSSADGKAPIAVLKLLESSAAAVKCAPLLKSATERLELLTHMVRSRAGRLSAVLACWLAGCLVGWLAGWLAGWLVGTSYQFVPSKIVRAKYVSYAMTS